MADRTGLEPATSGVTGRHSNQLNYRSALNCVTQVGRKTLFQSKQNTYGVSLPTTLNVPLYKMVGGTGIEPVPLAL